MEDALEQLAALARESALHAVRRDRRPPPPRRPRWRPPARRRHGRLARPVAGRRGRASAGRRRARRRPRRVHAGARGEPRTRLRDHADQVRPARRRAACARPTRKSRTACFDYLSRELSITTPHYILAVGEDLGALSCWASSSATGPTRPATLSSCGSSTTPPSRSSRWRRPTSSRERDAKERKAVPRAAARSSRR